jgi:hypothetical protein
MNFSKLQNNDSWIRQGATGGFTQVPITTYVICFNLESHNQCSVFVDCMTPYEYDESMRHSIVLPDHHRNLIEALTGDLGVFADEDVVKGKSGGVNILAVGPPGCGKTLTAEIYSEVSKRPLYRVAAAQLGTDGPTVEENLKLVMDRAQRWGAVLLIDEADVYVRQRGDDLAQNAVVAAFLRSMEYFSGISFLTSNRGGDIDEAIKSRCIAVIRYQLPTVDQAKQIWALQAKVQGIPLPDAVIDLLVSRMPELSGRDIKELLKLTSRYLRARNEQPNGTAFFNCAVFRDVKIVDPKKKG